MRSLYDWISKYGITNSIYSDYKSLFYTGREPTVEEQLAGEPATEFGRVCNRLGIELIYASTPQAKGRVERWNGVHQDRLVSELKLKGIKDISQANEFLKTFYWDKNNRKFSIKPISDDDMHVKLLKEQDLRNFVCFTDERTLYRDYTLRINNRRLQLTTNQATPVRPGERLEIKTWLDGSLHVFKGDVELKFYEIDKYGRKVTA